MYDAVVVGAGPAGSSVALRLARRGLTVAIIERARFPRTKVCGEYLSPGAVLALDDLEVAAPVYARAHRIRTIVLAGFGVGPVDLTLPGDGALALPRADLDDLLLTIALQRGAELISGSFIASDSTDECIRVAYRDAAGAPAHVDARVLIGADGAWSMVATRNDMAKPQRRGGRWAVGGHLPDQPDGDVLEMFAGRDGYFARNPLGRGLVNEMLVMPKPTPDEQTDAVALAISDGRRRFERDRLLRRVAVGPLRYRPECVARGRVLLTGDAAGLVDPFTGQGVALALMMSAHAATAAEALVANEPLSGVGRRYSREHRALVLPRRRSAAIVDIIIRVPFLRRRALRRFQRHPSGMNDLLAAIAGVVPPNQATSPRRLVELVR